MIAPFTRELRYGDVGPDVEGVKRALCRAGYGINIRVFNAQPLSFRRRWGNRAIAWEEELERAHGRRRNGIYEQQNHADLVAEGAFDAKATNLMLLYRPPHQIVFPLPRAAGGAVCQGLHETAGVPGNWAIDFCASAGTGVLAVEDSELIRLSGHDPSDDTADAQGVFGWTSYLQTRAGYVYFVTHLGDRTVTTLGARLLAGEIIGHIGNQHYRPDHVHYGVTSPISEADAKRRITTVASSSRVTPEFPV